MTDAAQTTPRQSPAERIAAKRAAKAAEKAARRGVTNDPGHRESYWARISGWVEDNARVLGLGVGGIVVVGAAVVGTLAFMEQRAHASGEVLWSAVEAARGQIVAAGETGPEDDELETFESAAARDEAALERYRKAASEGGELAWTALGEATALSNLGKHDEARKAFARVRELAKGDVYVEARALEGLGVSFEAQDDTEQAMKQYETLATLGEGRYRLVGDYHRARLLAAQDKRAEALEILDAALGADATTPAGKPVWPSVRDGATRLREELAVALDKPRLQEALPGGTNAATQEIIEQLKKQLEQAPAGESGE